MKRIFKSFYLSSLVYFAIVLTFFLFHVIDLGYENVSIIDSYLPTIFLFYTPIIITSLFFHRDFKSIDLLKSTVTSLILNYILLYFLFKLIYPLKIISFFNSNLLGLSIISFTVSLFIGLIFIIRKKRNKIVIVNKSITYSSKFLVIIPLIGVIIYAILMIITKSSFFNKSIVWSNLLPLGILCSFISFYLFKRLYTKTYSYNRNILIVSYYILSTIIFVCVCHFLSIIMFYSLINATILSKSLIKSLVLFSPFYLFITLLTHLYFLKLVSKQEKKLLTQQSLESQLNYQQLKNQISPHFLFNNINVLTSLIEENPKKAVTFSENLSHIYRYFLEQEKQDVVLVKAEIEFAKSYLQLLKSRFEVGFNYSISIDEKINEKYIVSTILQLVLENVVKHNIINEMNIVDVKITSNENYLIIENNKILKSIHIENSKNGIKNIKQRIAYFTDDKVIIEDSETHFVIKLPILETV